jgi:hypothetical protein
MIDGTGSLMITQSTVSRNSASHGAGVLLRPGSGELNIFNSTISGNTARLGAAAISSASTENVSIAYSTITDNHSGAYNIPGYSIGVLNLHAPQVSMIGSIFSGACGYTHFQNQTTVFVGSYNVISSQPNHIGTCANIGLGQGAGTLVYDLGPELGPLQNNGGPTETHAVPLDSVAIDFVPASLCPGSDQRGTPRREGWDCDVGAYQH